MGVFGAGYDVNTFSFIKCSFNPGFLSLKERERERRMMSIIFKSFCLDNNTCNVTHNILVCINGFHAVHHPTSHSQSLLLVLTL